MIITSPSIANDNLGNSTQTGPWPENLKRKPKRTRWERGWEESKAGRGGKGGKGREGKETASAGEMWPRAESTSHTTTKHTLRVDA